MAGRQKSSGRRSGEFDAFDVSLRGATLSGRAQVDSMPRVVDRLAQESPGETADSAKDSTEVSWRIIGVADAQGRPALDIELDGSVPLECQRCLQAFTWPLRQRTTLLLARNERELEVLDAEDETLEVILADAPQDALTLIEDEVLLALPFAPRCERPGCAGNPLHSLDPDAPRTSAFAALAGLKHDDAK